MTLCLAFFVLHNLAAIRAVIAIAGGFSLLVAGSRLLVRERLLLGMRTSTIHSAAVGLVEVTGKACGPGTIAAPITGHPSYLYRTVAWRRRNGGKQWENVADETLHVPFFLEDSSGRVLIEPFGADLDLHCDFHEEYDQPFVFAATENVPACVSAFLSRHGIAAGSRLRIEEWSIKPDDTLFVAGTLMENPGISAPAMAKRNSSGTTTHGYRSNAVNEGAGNNSAEDFMAGTSSARLSGPQIIRLSSAALMNEGQPAGQQAKIAAALVRAGITRPEAWAAAGVPYQELSATDLLQSDGSVSDGNDEVAHSHSQQPGIAAQDQPVSVASPDGNLSSPLVLMKGADDPTLVISFRSRKEVLSALAWKSAAMIGGGAALMLLGFYAVFKQIHWL